MSYQKAKEHLEQMVEITKKIGYNDLKFSKKAYSQKKEEIENNYEQEREE